MDNLSTVYLPMLIDFITILNEEYIHKILALFEEYRLETQYQEYCECLIEVLLNLLRIFEFLKLKLDR